MKYKGKNEKSTRNTICISTQVGCGMRCVFCATGKMGFYRNLKVGEIVEQVIFFARKLKNSKQRITNIVYMGMGEPFQNYLSVLNSIDILNSSVGLNLGLRRFTISTVGLVPGIQKLAKDEPQVNLAVSLHAADDQLRNSLIPINIKYPLEVLMEACNEYVSITNRRISFEWVLIENVNDSLQQAQKLVSLIMKFRNMDRGLFHVNLIQLNPTTNFKGNPSTNHKSMLFKNELESNQIPCTIRQRRGIDINAGCGQLATNA
jgi:23S rRNA (adenine2503-C2)-methyltransferase